jgi:hypothetical protein
LRPRYLPGIPCPNHLGGIVVMLTPERIFVVQINDKAKAYRRVSFTDQINVETWISTPISNPRFKRTRNIFSTTMLMASLTVSFK